MMGNDRHSEDLAQEVLLRAYRARKRYVAAAKFSTWLFTIAHNVVFNARRSQFRRREISFGGGCDSLLDHRKYLRAEPDSKTALEMTSHDEAGRMVRIAVAQLCDRQRVAISLFYLQGLSYAEIADVMEATPVIVKALLRRGRINLRELMTPYSENGELPKRVKPARREVDRREHPE
jgi:RNA polymerase sigma-70 factor (ECF subfamily)